MSEQQCIAEEATFQISVAMQYVDWLRSTLAVLRDRLHEQEANKQYADLAEMAIYNAERWHNELDVDREVLEKRTTEAFAADSAPQNASNENVARIPLAQFSKGRQSDAGADLGVTQTAINKALKIGREIYVTPNDDGSFSAFEVKPFPGRDTSEDAE
jgi:uncharacterized protein (DUF2267 family)